MAEPREMPASRILAWMCVLIGVNQLGFGGVIPALPLYAQSFGVSVSAVGAAIAVYGLARFAVAIPTGTIADRFGRRQALILGSAVTVAGNIWCAEASGYTEFIIARFVAGLGAGAVLVAGQIVLADISTPESRGRTIALYQGTFLFTVGVGPFPGGWLAEHYGLDAPFHAYAVAGLGAAAVAYWLVPETRGYRSYSGSGPRLPRIGFLAQSRLLIGQIGFALVSLVSFVNAFTRTGALFAIVPIVGASRLGMTTTEVGLGMALGSLAGLIVTYPAGSLADRYGRKPVIVPACCISGVAYLLFCFAPTQHWFMAAFVLWGVASAIAGAAPAAYAADSAPEGMNAAAMSTFRMLSDIGYVIGPIALGAVVDIASPTAALAVCAVCLIATAIGFGMYAPETLPARR